MTNRRWAAADEAVVELLDEANRIAASAFSASADDARQPGLYAWFVDVEGATHLSEGALTVILPGLVYAGQAGAGASTATVGSRIKGNHLGGTITGSTFRMTLAALLARRLRLRDDGGRALVGDGETRLTAWMQAHLSVAVVPEPDRTAVRLMEHTMLERIDPPLNLQGRPPSALRSAISARRRRPIGGAAR